jgi:hypothetical protein
MNESTQLKPRQHPVDSAAVALEAAKRRPRVCAQFARLSWHHDLSSNAAPAILPVSFELTFLSVLQIQFDSFLSFSSRTAERACSGLPLFARIAMTFFTLLNIASDTSTAGLS